MPIALSTDLYELTMMAGYHAGGSAGTATFELWVRALPPSRSFLIAAGLEQALDYLESLRFSDEEIAYLRALPNLRGAAPEFFDDYLPSFRFTGEVWAVEEGSPIFPLEPLLRVTAPLPEAQLVETALLSTIMFQTSVASKAARVVGAAAGRQIIEFGGRRAHGSQAAMLAARAAFLGGCDGSSNVEAGFRFGIPQSGTMAHSWVMTFADEVDAFREYARLFGDRAVFLLDTYDTIEAARRIVAAGLRPSAVRLDSGDLVSLSRSVRDVLDRADLRGTRILASGDLDEYRIAHLVAAGAPIDGFGVGAALSTASDAPSLGGIYKLVELERDGVSVPRMKLSPGKRSYPGRKQVWRILDHGTPVRDVVALAHEARPIGGVPLLERVMRNGRRVGKNPKLADLRARCRAAVDALPSGLRTLHAPGAYEVELSATLRAEIERGAKGLASKS